MNNKKTIWFFSIILIIPIIAATTVIFLEKRVGSLPVLGPTGTEQGRKTFHTIDSFSMINQAGDPVSITDWNNKIVVANFFFTHCPVICPTMTKNLVKVQNQFNEDEILINSFSIDPVRDSAEQLKQFSERYGIESKNWNLLTGDKQEIYRLARKSFLVVATDGDGGPNDFIHSEKLVLIDKQRRIRGFYTGTEKSDVDQLIIDIKKLKNEN